MENCGDALVAIATITAVIITGIVTVWQVRKENKNTISQLEKQHKDSIRQMEAETQILKKRKQSDQTLEALQRCWGLLIYTTDNENEKTIITYTVEKTNINGTDEKKYTYYFHKSNIDSFIDSLRIFFYTDGWGLYLSKELKENLFGYERIIWGLKLCGEKAIEDKQQITNHNIAKSLFEIHNKLIKTLHQDMNSIYS